MAMRNERLAQDNRISPDIIFSEKPPTDSQLLIPRFGTSSLSLAPLLIFSLSPLDSALTNEKISAIRQMRQQSRDQRVRRLLPPAPAVAPQGPIILPLRSNFGNIGESFPLLLHSCRGSDVCRWCSVRSAACSRR
jgi:hypothetical protein